MKKKKKTKIQDEVLTYRKKLAEKEKEKIANQNYDKMVKELNKGTDFCSALIKTFNL